MKNLVFAKKLCLVTFLFFILISALSFCLAQELYGTGDNSQPEPAPTPTPTSSPGVISSIVSFFNGIGDSISGTSSGSDSGTGRLQSNLNDAKDDSFFSRLFGSGQQKTSWYNFWSSSKSSGGIFGFSLTNWLNVLVYGALFVLFLEAILNLAVWVFGMKSLRRNPLFKPAWKLGDIVSLMIAIDVVWLLFVYIPFLKWISLLAAIFGFVILIRRKPGAAYLILPATFFIPLFIVKYMHGSSIFTAIVHSLIVAFLEIILAFMISKKEVDKQKAKERGEELAENMVITDELTKRIAKVVKEDRDRGS